MSGVSVRAGVDIGGTFTDTVLAVGDRLFSSKVLTTYSAPEHAIIESLRNVVAQAGISPDAISMVIHGTTLVTNALIERRGARTALITTQGFRDVIEMRRENRFEQYDLDMVLPPPLIARADRHTIGERVDCHGEVLKAIDEAELQKLAERIVGAGYESVAIGLIHSYANGAHEQRVASALRKLKPDISLSLSSEVSPQIREFERFNTVCVNAYVRPLVSSYLGRLSASFAAIGVTCPVYLMHSGGGLISVEDAARFPVRLLESGPAGGAIFAAKFAAAYDIDRLLSYDMGGTTAKICLIEDKLPKTTDNFEVARTYRFKKGSGMPVSVPVIEMVEIGAGGGSIGNVDALRQIRVGPESAGSEPGPACYDRGGKSPTVTDANLVLGRLDPDRFAGGSITLSRENADAAVTKEIGKQLELDVGTAAFGICEVVDENMSNAARAHAVENGRDLSEFTMIAFGGAAPIHACRMCEKLGIDELLVPPGAGVGSAIGFLTAPFGYETVRSSHRHLADLDAAWLNRLIVEMKSEAAAFVATAGGDAKLQYRARAFMRYRGQGWEIPVDIADTEFGSDCVTKLRALFEAAYQRLFGRTIPLQPIEIVSWSMQAATPLPPVRKLDRVSASNPAPVVGSRRIFDAGRRTYVEAAVIDRTAMAAGAFIEGPAVIVEDETSTFITSAFSAVMQADGTLHVKRRPAEAKTSVREHASETIAGVDRQIMWNRLIAVVEEQAKTLVRTAFSTSVREAGDLSAGVFDRDGNMLAQAVTGTPGHVNAMAEAVGHFMRDIGEDNIFENDVYITNDPWKGTGHLHDITVVRPSFRGGVLIGFFAATAHVIDIGGRGFGPDGREVYEEGLYIPIMKLAERGTMNESLLRLVRANVREPFQVVGDIFSLAACTDTGHDRLMDMMDEFDLNDLVGVAEFILSRSREATLDFIAKLPQGQFDNEMTIDGYDRPVSLKVALAIGADHVSADFAGTSGVSSFGVNVPMIYTRAYACYGLKCAIAPMVPNNAASLAPFRITAPEGSILNALHPAPVSVRHVIGHMVPDLVLGALHKCLPGQVPAEGAGALWNIHISARPLESGGERRNAEVLMFNSGGTGARAHLDGMSATAFPSGVHTMSVEATEQVGPIVVWRKELRQDSGGAGRYRGGLGQSIEIQAASGYELHFNAMFDRVDHPARGRAGGTNGSSGSVKLDDGTVLRGKGRQPVPAPRRLLLDLPGGGGFGPSAERDANLVRRDVAAGYISAEQAAQNYDWQPKD